jgi:FkbM family methyltransferase
MYHSQLGQDKYIVEEIFQHRRGLTFCDVGAYDGVKFSNTLFMERELGWRGVCIEPMPRQYQQLVMARSALCVNCCVADFEGTADFTLVDGHKDSVTMLSGLSAYIEGKSLDRINSLQDQKTTTPVKVRRLSNILLEEGISRLDYLSIDAEGAEPKILEDLFAAGVEVDCLTVEQNYGDRKASRILLERGYRQVKVFDGYEFVFCRSGFGPT